jgi:uncharacterized delta-60 repeat protein
MIPRAPGRRRLVAAIAFATVLGAVTAAYALDSDLDPTFDGPSGTGNGKFSLPITAGLTSDNANDVAIQADGKIVVVGDTDALLLAGSDDDLVLARFNVGGTLDAGFGGGDGIVITKVAGDQDDFASGVAIQGDGKIVVSGAADVDPTATENFDFVIARYNTDGTRDTDSDADPLVHLDNDGIFTTPVGSAANADDEAFVAAIQADGKIVAAGPAQQTGGEYDFGLVRLNPDDGSLDDTFDGDLLMPGYPGDGKVTTDFVGDSENANAIAIQSDNKIVVAGDVDSDPSATSAIDFGLARYNGADGTLDSSFDGDGRVTTDFTGSDFAYGLAIQPSDGRLVAVGTSATTGDVALARYLPADGSPDNAFGGDGKVTTPLDSSFAVGVAIQADGKIVTAGRADVDPTVSTNFDFLLTRYGADGALDPTFAGDGILTGSLAPAPGGDFFFDVAIDGSGRLVAVGFSTIPGNGSDWALARYGFNPPPPIVTPPIVAPSPTVSPPATTFNLAAAIKRCKKKFPKGKKRKRCIRRAKRHAAAT